MKCQICGEEVKKIPIKHTGITIAICGCAKKNNKFIDADFIDTGVFK